MKTLGICFGATSIQYVILQADIEIKSVVRTGRIEHEGNPQRAFIDFIESIDPYEIDRIVVTGRNFRDNVTLTSITEPEAVETALVEEFREGTYPNLVISSGGENQLVYKINPSGRIMSVHSGNKCASGTGEFFLQQIRRMGLNVNNAVTLASQGTPYKIAGRCSVFCKSDCTHALNKGEPVQNIVSGLCTMMVDKIGELIKDMPCDNLVVIGGGVFNTAMLDILKKTYANVIVPDHAATFEAYGAALWALNHPCIELPANVTGVIVNADSMIAYHPPLSESAHLVEYKESERGDIKPKDVCILGLDAGSTTTKAVLLRKSDKKILADVYLRTNGNPVEASKKCYASILNQVGDIDVAIVGLGVTGSGRQIAGLHALSDTIINEIIAHATAAAFYDKDVDTLFEIGGQDAKYTYLTNGIPSDYAMNEACSAGTGSFLEESAFETLGVLTENIGTYALSASKPPDFTDQCAAFISSDIKRTVQQGISKDNILAGLVYSICLNYINRVKGHRAVGKRIFMQGGVCYNKAVPVAMASILKSHIIVPPEPGLMGAFGVALEVLKRIELGAAEEKEFNLQELAGRHAVYKGTFTCAGGKEKCDRKCEIARIHINDKTYAFGGICDRYYNQRIEKKIDTIEELDLVAFRQKLLFDVYGPGSQLNSDSIGHKPRSVGLSRSLLLHSLYPLYSNFFSRLGFRVVLPEVIDQAGISRAEAAFCLPVEIGHGSFYNLLKQRCDYIFMPQVMQIPVPKVPTYSRLCPFVQGEPYYLKTTFRKEIEYSGTVILSPVLKMQDSYKQSIETFVKIAQKMGISEKPAREAYLYACDKQIAFEKELQRYGKKALYAIGKSGEKFAIVLFGRPYNTFADEINMGIPHKVASRGYTVIPYDMLPVDTYKVDKKMFWAMGQKIMKAAKFVQEHDNLFAFYVTNFSCGPDSFLLGYFRDVMGQKPSLTLELDQHTADAGIDTRIEAAVDIIKRYRRMRDQIAKKPSGFTPARVEYPYVYSSSGKKYHITESSVEILIPSFGHYTSEAVAAVLRRKGVNARALPILDKEGHLTGKKNTTCKECLPYIINAGSLLKYIENRGSSNKVSLFLMATGGGPCRLGQYFRALESLIRKRRIPDTAILTITDENGYNGLGIGLLLQAWQGIVLTDVLGDVKSLLKVAAVDLDYAMNVFETSWKKCIAYFEGKLSIRFTSLLKLVSMHFARIPLKVDPKDVPVISLVGEIFVRRDEFSRKNIVDYFEKRGFMVRVAPLAEYICYSNYVVNNGLGERKFDFHDLVKIRLVASVQEWWEKRIKSLVSSSGLYKFEMIEVEKTIKGIKHLLDENVRGECILTVGLGMREILDDACGVVAIGPFGCMYSRMAEAILKKEMDITGKRRMPGWEKRASDYRDIGALPFLSIETDGNPFPQIIEANLESFVMQARRVHEKLMALKGRRYAPHRETVADMLIKK